MWKSVFDRWGRALLLLLLLAPPRPAAAAAPEMSPQARTQIQALLSEKESRSAAQRKLDSNLLYAARQARGFDAAVGVSSLATGIATDAAGKAVVDITAFVSDDLLATLRNLGAEILDVQRSGRSIRARVPLASLETIAGDPSVVFIQPQQRFRVRAAGRPQVQETSACVPTNTSEGDVTHRANLARSTFGVSGAGIKVGVLSDGVGSLAALQASCDLPPVVTVLPGQAGSGTEGSAMLEIVHDLAPDAELFYATGNSSIASMATNILALRAAGCDILIDDIGWDPETPFQKGQAPSVVSTTNGGLIIQAVNTVVADGALYFSAVGNDGNKDSGNSGTWEGDFTDAGAVSSPIPGVGRLHDFDPGPGVAPYDTLASDGSGITLFWSDPLGAASDDYDLFVLDAAGSNVVASSTNLQTGTQDPFEEILSGFSAGQRIVIVQRSGSARFLHMGTLGGTLSFSTNGEAHGHSAPPSDNAFGVAATPAPAAYPNPFNSSDVVENFSSDGPRRYFFHSDGAPLTPGNVSSTGGQLVDQPAFTGADRVSCAAPFYANFSGTSAAAPHAGAIAALIKSAAPGLTAGQVTAALTTTAIDIQAPGFDRDSGAGILDAFAAVQSVIPPPTSLYTLTPCRVVDTRAATGALGGPALLAGASRTFPLGGHCGIPMTAKAISVNVTVTQASASGDLRVFSAGAPLPPVSTINYSAGQTRAGNAVVKVGPSAGIGVHCDQSSGTVQLIVDVNGYFQ